jgi:ribosome-associated heat shock protein Hsp15
LTISRALTHVVSSTPCSASDMTTPPAAEAAAMRIDKWLWAARFYKTRHLAVEAINGGKIEIDGQRAKPAKTVKAGSRVTLRKETLSWELTVLGVSKQRRPAAEALQLYAEDEASRLRRQDQVRERRETGVYPDGATRPSKRNRRLIQRFTGKGAT